MYMLDAVMESIDHSVLTASKQSARFSVNVKFEFLYLNRMTGLIKLGNKFLTLVPFTPLQSHFPHDAPQP